MKTLARAILVLVVAFSVVAAVRATRFDLAMQRGIVAYNRGDVDAVLGGFRDALAIDDRDALTWAWMGDAASYVYDYHSDGAEIDPELGRSLLDEAWVAYARSVFRSPAYMWSWAGLASTAERRHRLDSSVRGVDLMRFQRLSQGLWEPTLAAARSAGEIALDLNPSGFLAMDALGDVYAEAGRPERAAALYERSALVLPAPSMHSWGGGRRLPRVLYAAVLEALEAGIARAPEFERSMLHVDVGRFARAQGDPATALARFEAAEAAAADDYRRYQARWELGSVAQELGDYDRAIDATLGVIETGFAIAPARRRLANLYDLVGRFEEACAEFGSMRFDGDDGTTWRMRAAGACEKAGDLARAETILRDGLVDPHRQKLLARALLDLLLRHRRTNTATTLVERWLADHPQDEDFRAWALDTGS